MYGLTDNTLVILGFFLFNHSVYPFPMAGHLMGSNEAAVQPRTCPFCGTDLPSPGAGFIRHIEESGGCHEAFETWRDRVAEDIRGGWAG